MSSSPVYDRRVLVVGAGPSGLTLGIELLRRGVDARVIDKLDGPVTTSRSFTVHARTLELLELAGVVEEFQDRGLRGEWMDYHFQGAAEKVRLDFTGLDSRYPYYRALSQQDTEEILRRRFTGLGGVVDWQRELVAVDIGPGGEVTATVRDTRSGRTETVRPHWLIGCDGVRSTVAAALGAPADRVEYAGTTMRMMDVPLRARADRPVEVGGVDYRITRDRMLLTAALPGGVWRVLISDTGDARVADMSVSAFQAVVDEHFGGAVRLGTPQWSSVFRTRRRLTSRYRNGRVLVCGDAGHERSPAGGQGMNTSMQDAFNLGWKLAAVVHGDSPAALLDTYEAERRPIAEQVKAGTHELHSVLMNHGMPLAERLAMAREPGFTDRAVARISGLAYRYPATAAAHAFSGRTRSDGLGAGDRAPDVEITPRLRLYEKLRHPGHTLLITHRDPSAAAHTAALVHRLYPQFGHRVQPVVITPPGHHRPAPAGAITADSHQVHERYGAPATDTLCLIRPDGYLACRTTEHRTLHTALRATFA
ncbi:FAD-dependent monooxygenase [Nocardia sienata]|uniref:FAD-dependent monooxygenase n=1 Tax=Nocardia sienata TaxID=248552 RepID=UPI000A06FE8B|nr:FAD-dependent monooxygenase [Nocardia sienata]